MIYRYAITPPADAPIRITVSAPEDTVVGAPATLLAQVVDGRVVTWSWTLISAPESATTSLAGRLDTHEATLRGDVPGVYVVEVVGTDADRRIARAQARVPMHMSSAPLYDRTVAPGTWALPWIGSVWRGIENRLPLEVFWSALLQVASDLLLGVWTAERNLSLFDVQDARRARWMGINPEVTLTGDFRFIFAPSGARGVQASTCPRVMGLSGVILDAQHVYLSGAPARPSDVGQILRIQGSGARGDYTIRAVSPDGRMVTIQRDQRMNIPEPICASTSLQLRRTSTTIFDPMNDLEDAGVRAMDVLLLASPVRTLLTVTTPPSTAGLSAHQATITPAPPVTRTQAHGMFLRALPMSILRAGEAVTDTVRIEDAPDGLFERLVPTLQLSGELLDAYRLRVDVRYTHTGLVGGAVRFLTDIGTVREVSIVASDAKNEWLALSAPVGTHWPQAVQIELLPPIRIDDRMLQVGDRAWRIRSVSRAEDGTWDVALWDALLPTGQEGMSWAWVDVLHIDEDIVGISPGDILRVQVESSLRRACWLPGRIIDARGRHLAIAAGRTGDGLDDSDLLYAASTLQIPRGIVDAQTGVVVWDMHAAGVVDSLRAPRTKTWISALPYRKMDAAKCGHLWFRATSATINRQTILPVPDDLLHAPVLTEYVNAPEIDIAQDGFILATWKDGTSRSLPRQPLVLVEGDDFVVRRPVHRGRLGALLSGWFHTTELHATRYGVQPGDVLRILSGYTPQDAIVARIAGDAMLLIDATSSRVIAHADATGLRWQLRRRQAYTALTVWTTFDHLLPYLFAREAVRDNLQTIDRSWGDWLGLRASDYLDAYAGPRGEAQYITALQALLMGWLARGQLRRVESALHALLGEPIFSYPTEIQNLAETETQVVLTVQRLDAMGLRTGDAPQVLLLPKRVDILGMRSLAQHPTEPWRALRAGDRLPAWYALTRRVVLYDRHSPRDMQQTHTRLHTRLDGLRAVHHWWAHVDATLAPPALRATLRKLLREATPAHTAGALALVVYLQDTLSIEDVFRIATQAMFYSDITGAEATYMVDALNGSGAPLRVLGIGTLQTRSILMGYDLVTVIGEVTATSARGGFVDIPSNPIRGPGTRPVIDATPTDTPYENNPEDLPHQLIRSGDYLRVFSGPNQGWYRVAAVEDDTTLTLGDVYVDEGVAGVPVSMLAEATDQPFMIFRKYSSEITSVLDVTVAEDGVTVTQEADRPPFIWEAVAPGDLIEFSDGSTRLVRVVDGNAQLTLAAAVEPGAYEARISRPALQPYVLFEDSAGLVGDAGSYTVVTSAPNLATLDISFGAQLVVTSGDMQGMVFQVAGRSTNDPMHTLLLTTPLPADAADAGWRLERPEGYAPADADIQPSKAAPSDRTELRVFDGRQVVLWCCLTYVGEGVWSSELDVEFILASTTATTRWWVELDLVCIVTIDTAGLSAALRDGDTYTQTTLLGAPLAPGREVTLHLTGTRAQSDGEMALVRAYQSATGDFFGQVGPGEHITGEDENGDPFDIEVSEMTYRAPEEPALRGLFAADSIEGSQLSIQTPVVPDVGTVLHATIRTDAESWLVSGDTVQFVPRREVAILPGDRVRMGDIFVLIQDGEPAQSWCIREASGDTITLFEDSGLSTACAGYVRRVAEAA
jgi:hypothetical protein